MAGPSGSVGALPPSMRNVVCPPPCQAAQAGAADRAPRLGGACPAGPAAHPAPQGPGWKVWGPCEWGWGGALLTSGRGQLSCLRNMAACARLSCARLSCARLSCARLSCARLSCAASATRLPCRASRICAEAAPACAPLPPACRSNPSWALILWASWPPRPCPAWSLCSETRRPSGCMRWRAACRVGGCARCAGGQCC